jgi:2-oxoisovalerate dehydrogenase E1 component
MFAELFGREGGVCRGRGGSMHIADPMLGIFGANGIVGAGLPIGVGAATAAKLRDDGRVVVCFFGDGAVAQGAFHEAVNLAAVWRLPVVFLCENNGYAEFSAAHDQHPVPLVARAGAYGLEHIAVAGNDIEAMVSTMSSVVGGIRGGGAPVVVEAETYRWHGHYEGDPESYRSAEEVAAWRERDPLALSRKVLLERGFEAELNAVESEVLTEIDAAVDWAEASDEPSPATLLDWVYSARPVVPEPAWEPVEDTTQWKYFEAVREALAVELDADDGTFLAGIDIGAPGNVFGVTRGLFDRFPGRVLDTPISETAIMGVAVGAAMAGMRPVVELMYLDFLGVCLDQLMNQAAKLRYMTGGRASLPLVVRTQFGGGRSSGSQHSQSLEAILSHIPGLTVVMPSTPADAYGLLRAAIRDPSPVVFIENRQLYGMRGPRPPEDHIVPLGRAAVRRPGRHVTVVSVSAMLHTVCEAAAQLEAEGIEAEVIDLRTVMPLDVDTIARSVTKTARLLVVHEAVAPFGLGAELAALAAGDLFWDLDAPVRRLTPPATPVPYAPSLERAWRPDTERIVAAIRSIVAE